jgi:hypothetical protein
LRKIKEYDIAKCSNGTVKREAEEKQKTIQKKNVWEWFVSARWRHFAISGTVVQEYTK